ncbi:MAG: hypothetical protein KF866_08370 [Phycisphaeraceae bacterium]|nr:hypothetical protein [Phycisphaeraceae bacterium]MCW5753891.1 hypothetical protein [Phycisphaeraceae bacterium]
MNPTLKRRLGLQTLIAVGVCAGGWAIAVRPAQTDLQESSAAYRTQQRTLQSSQASADAAQVEMRLANLLEEARAIDSASLSASSASALYSRFNQLAAEHGVRIENIQPGKSGRSALKPVTGLQTSSVSFEISASAHFNDLVRFIRSIENSTGLGGIVAVHLARAPSAGDEPERITATIQTQHVSLEQSLVRQIAAFQDAAP